MTNANTLASVCFCALALACGPAAPAASAPALPDVSSVDLAGVEGALGGTIAGTPFETRDARFRVITYAGRERVDLLFSDRAIERCGLPLARDESRVWLRVPHVTALVPGELALLDEPEDDAPIEVHYERPNGRAFVEAHRALARLEITRASAESVEGRLHACFADAARSCVAGTFRATPCRSRIDGRALREPPGLADEALAPLLPPAPRTTTEPAEQGP